MSTPNVVDFYFDFISPYSYLAWHRVGALCAAHQAELRLHPILLAGLLNHWGQLGPAEIPPKREFTFKDVLRYAAHHGIEINLPKMHPFNPLLPLRIALGAPPGQAHAIIDALWRATWTRRVDVSSPAELGAALNAAGFDGKALIAAASEPETKAALRRETDGALAAGVFGVPTAIAHRADGESELFWGNDRLDYLAYYLDGKDLLDSQLARAARDLPRGPDRPRRPPAG